MKNKSTLKQFMLVCLILTGCTNYSNAAADNDSNADENSRLADLALPARLESPNGGRLITIVEPQFEFFLTAERFAQITFIGENGEFIPLNQQMVSAIGGDRSAPTKVEFIEHDGKLISKEPLPEIKNMPIILQIKVAPEAEIVREKFYLNMDGCSSCSFREYACICGH